MEAPGNRLLIWTNRKKRFFDKKEIPSLVFSIFYWSDLKIIVQLLLQYTAFLIG